MMMMMMMMMLLCRGREYWCYITSRCLFSIITYIDYPCHHSAERHHVFHHDDDPHDEPGHHDDHHNETGQDHGHA